MTSSAPTTTFDEALRFEGLTKTFGATRALDRVDLIVNSGEIHGLLGQNGSGKSTLIKVLAGLHAPDEGDLWLSGVPIEMPLAASQRRDLNMAFVHQDLGLMPELSVSENFWSQTWAADGPWRRINWRHAHRRVGEVLESYGVGVSPKALVRQLTPVERALLAIVRAVENMREAADRFSHGTRGLLVLDEPTVFLAGHDAQRLYGLMRTVAREHAGVLFVSHDIDEVLDVTDRVTVFRDGKNAGTRDTAELTVSDVVKLMLGEYQHAVVEASRVEAPLDGAKRDGTQLSVSSMVTRRLPDGLSFTANQGQIVGLAGLPGSGFEDVLYALYGATPAEEGTMTCGDSTYQLAQLSPSMSRNIGCAFIPSDRLTEGCIPALRISENNMIPRLEDCRRGPIISPRTVRELTAQQIESFGVRISGPEAAYATMSGGNQQKAILAKWLDTNPAVVLLSQPTQGVDIGARSEIWQMLKEGAASRVTICSSLDHDELARLCDVVLVFRKGRIVANLTGDELTKTAIGHYCAQGELA